MTARLTGMIPLAALLAAAACAAPPPPTPKEIAAARALVIGEWNCVRPELGEGRFVYRADGGGEQSSEGLRISKGADFITMNVSTTLTWSLSMTGPAPTKLTQNVLTVDAQVLAAEIDGANEGASRRFREKFETQFEEGLAGPGAFKILEATGDRLILQGARGENTCTRLSGG